MLNPECYSSMCKKEREEEDQIGNITWVEKGCVAMCISLLERSINGVAQHTKCRLVGSVERRRRRKVKGMDGIVEVCDTWNSIGFERDYGMC